MLFCFFFPPPLFHELPLKVDNKEKEEKVGFFFPHSWKQD